MPSCTVRVCEEGVMCWEQSSRWSWLYTAGGKRPGQHTGSTVTFLA